MLQRDNRQALCIDAKTKLKKICESDKSDKGTLNWAYCAIYLASSIQERIANFRRRPAVLKRIGLVAARYGVFVLGIWIEPFHLLLGANDEPHVTAV